MARFSRIEVHQGILSGRLLPLFHTDDPDVASRVAGVVAGAGVNVFEFTHRSDRAPEIFRNLVEYVRSHLPGLMLGVGSVGDAGTAALYAAAGADFIVSPSFDEGVARFCNRRKLAYMPGCLTPTEIARAEEFGAEIIKLFPAEAAGGPGFVRALMGPCPWTRLMPTGLEEVTAESLKAWFAAGSAAVGLGRALFSREAVAAGDWEAVRRRVSEVAGWVAAAKGCYDPRNHRGSEALKL